MNQSQQKRFVYAYCILSDAGGSPRYISGSFDLSRKIESTEEYSNVISQLFSAERHISNPVVISISLLNP